MERVPLQIKDQHGLYNYRDSYKKILSYSVKQDSNYVGFALRPYDIENKFEIINRPAPKSKIITQSKYDCAAASLAMLINKPLYYVKQALARHGWRNDLYGCSTEMMILAARDFGIDLFPVGPKDIKPGIGPCELCVPSLNYKGRHHAVVWDGEEILDPNYGYEGRKVYSTVWSPWTLETSGALVKMTKPLTEKERQILDKLVKRKTWGKLRDWATKFIARRGGLENL